VNLTPDEQRKGDWVNQFTPSLSFTEKSAHTQFNGSISLPVLLYARTSENNYVAPRVAVTGTVEALDRFLFVDASANVTQQYRSPFGALPNNLASATSNRYTAQSYTLSPYIRGLWPDGVDYELRDSNTWAVANGLGDGLGTGYSNHLTGHITRRASPLGWSIDYDRSTFRSENQSTETTSIARTRALYRPDPTVELSGSVGYEDNRFTFTQERGVTYGVGATWHPTDRTSLVSSWERRFFGSAYQLSFDHHTPLTAWSISASRDITNYPAQLASLPAGGNVQALLESLFSSKVPDPLQRQLLIDRIIRERGLPDVLAGPVTLFNERVTLAESQSATFGILGARHTVFFVVFRSRNRPVGGSDATEAIDRLGNISDSTQTGASVVLTRQMASDLTWATSMTLSRATSNQEPHETTEQYQLSSTLARSLSPSTSIYGGARVQESRSEIAAGYREFAVFFGVSYTFR
jgi:uncharacterized protein (PEP-CTERM system associated)